MSLFSLLNLRILCKIHTEKPDKSFGVEGAMLVLFRIQNFRSMRDLNEFSLVASSLKERAEIIAPVPQIGRGMGLLRAAAIYGANASGKSNVLKALSHLRWLVCFSQTRLAPDADIPHDPFLMDLQSRSQPSSFEIEAIILNIRYRYGFTHNSRTILEEHLYAFPEGRKQLWFERKESLFTFGKSLSGENRAIESLTRRNSLFLSAAAQNNHVQLTALYNWFSSNLNIALSPRLTVTRSMKEFCSDEGQAHNLLKFLLATDLGLVGMRIHKKNLSEAETTLVRDLYATIREAVPGAPIDDLPDIEGNLRFVHASAGDQQPVELGIEDESRGTAALLALAIPAISILQKGGILAVDELDASLHPLVALELVRLFNDPERNPRGAQLIFNTHDTNLLDLTVLRRDQIWFTEKDSAGATHLYPLTDFSPRKHENLQRGYLQGRYGAVPFVVGQDFLSDKVGQ